jgi:hypothetical protein
MRRRYRNRIGLLVLVGLGACLTRGAASFDLLTYLDSAGNNDITAVASKKSPSYIRIQLPNGTFIPESYVFGAGGVWRGEKVDATIDKVSFPEVAHMIAGALASQNYVSSRDPSTTKLLIMVYWGTSHGQEHASESNGYVNLQAAQAAKDNARMQAGGPPGGSGGSVLNSIPKTADERAADDRLTSALSAVVAENHMRDQSDMLNVTMLGYDSWWDDTQKYVGTPLDFRRDDLLGEIEEDRYFVVLMAYDFQQLWWKKKHRLLWETRFSIRERHHAFDRDLPSMAQYASQYFGQDSHGLVHKAVPMGHVDIGNVKSLGEAPGNQGDASGETPARP